MAGLSGDVPRVKARAPATRTGASLALHIDTSSVAGFAHLALDSPMIAPSADGSTGDAGAGACAGADAGAGAGAGAGGGAGAGAGAGEGAQAGGRVSTGGSSGVAIGPSPPLLGGEAPRPLPSPSAAPLAPMRRWVLSLKLLAPPPAAAVGAAVADAATGFVLALVAFEWDALAAAAAAAAPTASPLDACARAALEAAVATAAALAPRATAAALRPVDGVLLGDTPALRLVWRTVREAMGGSGASAGARAALAASDFRWACGGGGGGGGDGTGAGDAGAGADGAEGGPSVRAVAETLLAGVLADAFPPPAAGSFPAMALLRPDAPPPEGGMCTPTAAAFALALGDAPAPPAGLLPPRTLTALRDAANVRASTPGAARGEGGGSPLVRLLTWLG